MKQLQNIVCAVLLLLLGSCDGSNYISSVPSVPVYYTINVIAEDPSFVPASTGSYKIVTAPRYATDRIGYAGLLIYIGMDMNHHAFDLACPHCLNIARHVEVDGMYAVCPVCQEKYDLSYGYATPTTGVSKEALRKYRCNWNGTTLTVMN